MTRKLSRGNEQASVHNLSYLMSYDVKKRSHEEYLENCLQSLSQFAD